MKHMSIVICAVWTAKETRKKENAATVRRHILIGSQVEKGSIEHQIVKSWRERAEPRESSSPS